MATEREYETTVHMGGMDIPVTVDFWILSFPQSPSGYGFDGSYDPGEGGEIEIIKVMTEFGLDITATLDGMQESMRLSFALEHRKAGDDPLQAVLFPYRTTLKLWNASALDEISDKIMNDDALMLPPEDDDYDPRDWE